MSKFHSEEKKAFTRSEIADALATVGGGLLFDIAEGLDSDDNEGFEKLQALTHFVGLLGGQVLVELFDKDAEEEMDV